MDRETYAREHPNISTDSVSYRSAHIFSNPTPSLMFSQALQGPSAVLHEARTNSLTLDSMPYMFTGVTGQVNAESVLIRGDDERPKTQNHESPIENIHDDAGSPVACSLNTMRQTSLSLSKSTFPGSEVWWPASRVSNEDINPADMNTTRSWFQERATTNGPKGQGHCYAPVYTSFSSSVPLALAASGTSHAQTTVLRQARSTFQKQPHQFGKKGEGAAEASSRSSRWPASTGKIPKGSYSCDICRKAYAQPQGVSRHHRETHSTNKCKYCGDFEWGRPYRFKEHLKKRHPDVDPDAALDEATRTRRRATAIRIYPPHQRDLIPTPEYDLRSESQMRLTMGPSAVAKAIAGSPSFVPFVSYDPQPESAESKMKRRHDFEDVPKLQFLDVTEEHASARRAKNLDICL